MQIIKNFTRFVLIFTIFWCTLPLYADNVQPLPAEEAFALSGTYQNNQLILDWNIQPHYYLYRDRISYKIVDPMNMKSNKLNLPRGETKEDPILGKYEVLTGKINADIHITPIQDQLIHLKVCFQGCSENGFCYPPETKELVFDPKQPGKIVKAEKPLVSVKIQSDQDKITDLIDNHDTLFILLSFFSFGLLLTFTPCVLPMIPILSGIIAGHNESKTGHSSLALSFTYVLAMAVTYALAGVIAGYLGESLQSAMQSPWAISIFSLIFVLLSLSLFGFYELRLPHTVSEKLSEWSNRQKGGTYLGVALMGVLSTLIVSPCVTPPLIGALAYIGNTGNMALGGIALFSMGLGMGLPLIVIVVGSAKLLPKAGGWMIIIERILGVALLATAIWMISRILPGQISLLLWASLLIICAVYMGLLSPISTAWSHFWKGCALVMSIYGVILMIGAAMGNTNPLHPLEFTYATNSASSSAIHKALSFQRIKTNDDFDHALQQAIAHHQITMLDFYADWCIACKEMEEFTFSNSDVQALLSSMQLLKADVTANDLQDKRLMERFNVLAPPTLLFFDKQGNEIPSLRIIGYLSPEQFLQKLAEI